MSKSLYAITVYYNRERLSAMVNTIKIIHCVILSASMSTPTAIHTHMHTFAYAMNEYHQRSSGDEECQVTAMVEK